MERAKRIRCSAPLPEEPVIPRLAKMLELAPYKAPEKKATRKAKGVRSGHRRKGTLDVTSEDEDAHSSVPEDDDEEEEEEVEKNPPPKEKKRGGLHESGGGNAQEGEGRPCGQHRMGH